MTGTQTLLSASQLAATNTAHFPDKGAEYRTARNALLAEEIELRRHIERVAAQRRALPPGGHSALKASKISVPMDVPPPNGRALQQDVPTSSSESTVRKERYRAATVREPVPVWWSA